ncbi:lysozyme [Paenibacillus apiarius]|uniref:lysozyme n=1 Tax=Paenibacillus apiarius TaxID=46240 RepID=UPI003B3B35F2
MIYSVDMREQSAIDFAPADLVTEVSQNIRAILSTYAGSVPLARNIGLNHEILDEPIQLVKARLSSEIIAAVLEQEQRAAVTEVIIFEDAASGRLDPFVKFVLAEGVQF